ncbi:MAG TPA: hypothetical protein VNR38_10185 [Ureibacillus sp.]|nr:hypothetical protein [Ureibacillus sp.]
MKCFIEAFYGTKARQIVGELFHGDASWEKICLTVPVPIRN